MTITLYNNYSDYRTLYKDLRLVAQVTAEIKGSCSIDNPSLLINYNSGSVFNYFYIPAWGRYYKVSNRIALPGEHMMISGQSDPVESFNAGIAARELLIVRAEDPALRNRYLPDQSIPIPSDPQYEVIEGTEIISDLSSGMYVIGVV